MAAPDVTLDRDRDLTSMDLDDGALDRRGLERLAAALGRHGRLAELDLSRNVVGAKGAGYLAAALRQNRSLRVLILRAAQIGPVGAGRLAEALGELGCPLRELSLCGNKKVGDEGAGLLAASLAKNATLEVLDLAGCGVTARGAVALAAPIKAGHGDGCGGLKVLLRLRDNALGDEGAEALASAASATSCQLRELDLCRTSLAEAGVQHLAAAVAAGALAGGNLNLFGNTGFGIRGADCLAATLRRCGCRLQELDDSRCDLGNAGAEVFAAALRWRAPAASARQPVQAWTSSSESSDSDADEDTTEDEEEARDAVELPPQRAVGTLTASTPEAMREVCVVALNDGVALVESEAPVPERDAMLRELHLCRSGLTVLAARSFAETLQGGNRALLVLDLRDNNLGDQGAIVLAEACKENLTLRELDLSANSISDPGAKELGFALVVNISLTALGLAGNALGDEGAAALASGLEKNGSLLALDLRRNAIGEVGVGRLLVAVRKNSRLKELPLEGNEVEDWAIEAIAEALSSARAAATQPPSTAAVTNVTPPPLPVAAEIGSAVQSNAQLTRSHSAAEPRLLRASRLVGDNVAVATCGLEDLDSGFQRGVRREVARRQPGDTGRRAEAKPPLLAEPLHSGSLAASPWAPGGAPPQAWPAGASLLARSARGASLADSPKHAERESSSRTRRVIRSGPLAD